MGYATATQLARWGAMVIVTTRRRTRSVVEALETKLSQGRVQARIDGHDLDLADVDSVNKFTRWYEGSYGDRLDGLINNAGIHLDLLSEWKEPKTTPDGYEIQWRTNYLGTVQLTDSLLPLLKKTGQKYGEARIVNVVSQLHGRASNQLLFDENRSYESWQAYGLSKLALVHFSTELDRRFSDVDGLKSYSAHPGGVSGAYTNVANVGLDGHAFIWLVRKIASPIEQLFMASAAEGAQTQIHCATSTTAKSGLYFFNCQAINASEDASDSNAAARLWDETQEWLKKTKEVDVRRTG